MRLATAKIQVEHKVATSGCFRASGMYMVRRGNAYMYEYLFGEPVYLRGHQFVSSRHAWQQQVLKVLTGATSFLEHGPNQRTLT